MMASVGEYVGPLSLPLPLPDPVLEVGVWAFCCFFRQWKRSGWWDKIEVTREKPCNASMITYRVWSGCIDSWVGWSLDSRVRRFRWTWSMIRVLIRHGLWCVYSIHKECIRKGWWDTKTRLFGFSSHVFRGLFATDLGWKCPTATDNDSREVMLTTWNICIIMIASDEIA